VRLADTEVDALRHIATLVARGVPPAEIFEVVSDEVGRLFGSGLASVTRYEADGSAVMVGLSKNVRGVNVQEVTLGLRLEPEQFPPPHAVHRSGNSARVDFRAFSAPIGSIPQQFGFVSAVASNVVVEGRLWGLVTVGSREELPFDTEERLEKFTDLVVTAIANAENKSELAASRQRVITAADEARRRIERDLHDGTQQRLVLLALQVQSAQANVPSECDDLRAELALIAAALAEAVTELQEISRGVHPSNLSRGGLGVALRAMARRSAIAVELDYSVDGRLPEPIELTAYYLASEGLTNATKHAHASHVEIIVAQDDGANMRLSIKDDGVGGADLARGSGLVGLRDRIEALGGSIDIESPRGEGTLITAELPLASDPGVDT
jgi:signal transduction histidine kinase